MNINQLLALGALVIAVISFFVPAVPLALAVVLLALAVLVP